MPKKEVRVLFYLFLLIIMTPGHTRKWQVGPGRPYQNPSAVASLVGNGDTVEIDPVTYRDVCIWRANDLLLKGIGGKARLDATGMSIAEGKAIWVIKGKNNTVEMIEFLGAACPDQNGAGIRIEGSGLTVRNCYFHDNENGILSGADSTSDILIEYSEFGYNGYGDGYSHNIYIGHIRSFTFQHSYSHHAKVGHLVKSRAKNNRILYNRLTCESTGTSSYEIDLPNGGLSYIIGNLIHQGQNTSNSTVISYGREGIASGYDTIIYLVNNTMVNNRSSFGSFIAQQSGTRSILYNNIFYGGTRITNGGYHRGSNNWLPVGYTGADSLRRSVVGTDPKLKDPANYDYRLDSSSACIDSGIDPGIGLRPQYQYVHPCNREIRPLQGSYDIGAYEYIRVRIEEKTNHNRKGEEIGIRANPNPFISWTKIQGCGVKPLTVYDVKGEMRRVYYGVKVGADLPPGVYFIKDKVGMLKIVKID
ncbi:MAG: right-handed parallel beta-helix repeat-containing protein [candidate division WOR-3 bacterium]